MTRGLLNQQDFLEQGLLGEFYYFKNKWLPSSLSASHILKLYSRVRQLEVWQEFTWGQEFTTC